MSLFSASSAERAEKCAASHALPKVVGPSSAAAEAGKDLHRRLEAPDEAVGDDEVERVRAFAARVLSPGVRREVPLVWDWRERRARFRQGPSDRIGPTEVEARVDALEPMHGLVAVSDFKTGYKRVAPARDNMQLLLGALAAADLFKVDAAVVRVLYTRSEEVDEARLDCFDLARGADRVEKVARRVLAAQERVAAGGIPDVYAGDHCEFCKAFDVCPRQTSLARQLATDPEVIRVEGITASNAGEVYLRMKQAEKILGKVKDAVYAVARREDVDLGNGQYLGVRPSFKRVPDGDEAYLLLKEQFGDVVADDACRTTTSLKALRAVLSTVAKLRGVAVTHVVEEFLRDLAGRGGVQLQRVEQVRVRKRGDEGGEVEDA